MSKQYPGGIISKTAPVPSGPYSDSTAPGIWTLDQQAALAKQGNWPTAGNASPSAFIENLFSTYLYTGTGAAQTITNGINLSANGGLVWSKSRSAVQDNSLIDTVRGNGSILYSNLTSAADTGVTTGVTAFNTTGYALGSGSFINQNAATYASWTFREQPKFFDIVTYTGDGAVQNIAHSLGSVPGCVIIKRTDATGSWWIWHRSATNPSGVPGEEGSNYTFLQFDADAAARTTIVWNGTNPTSTVFTVGGSTTGSVSGATYVAYLFAHDAGGFGASGTDNVISCGSFTTDGTGVASVNLGYEPQWIMIKASSTTSGWFLFDTMRGLSETAYSYLTANSSGVESSSTTTTGVKPNATGFTVGSNFSAINTTYIYIAIRRGPMAVPTVGTSVYKANTYTGNATVNTTVAGNFGFPVDLMTLTNRDATATNWNLYGQYMLDRLQGQNVSLSTADTDSNVTGWNTYHAFDVQNSIGWGLYGSSSDTGYMNNSGGLFVARGFRRAPSFFDEVCYTGTGVATTQAHNLAAVPELMIVKRRSNQDDWAVYTAATGNGNVLFLNLTDAVVNSAGMWNSTTPTASVFSIGTSSRTNSNAVTYVAYLFATCAGVSKVGSYTGTGTTQVINCGFTSGARFVLIKRSDSTGDWYVWDSATGIVAGDDPYILLNSVAAQVTNTDYIDTAASGFEISSTAPAAINANGGTFIFLAIA
jgi:hypothetical protein